MAKTDLLFLGDSLTQFHDWSTFGLHHNAGIAGDTTDGLCHRLHYTLNKRPRTLVLQIGINDLLQASNVQSIQTNFLTIFTQLQVLHKVIIVSILPVTLMYSHEEVNARIILLNLFLKKSAEEYGFHFVDLYTVMHDDFGIKRSYTSDGVHLTPLGYSEFERALAPLFL